MVSFDDCEGNPGALRFMTAAYFGSSIGDAMTAERAFQRVIDAGIRGGALYVLWNDCCNRDTKFALEVMQKYDIEEIKRCIIGDGSRGYAIKKED